MTQKTFNRGTPADFRSCRNCSRQNECHELKNLTLAVPERVRAMTGGLLWHLILDAMGRECEGWADV